MDTEKYENWSEQLEIGNYGEFVALEPNPYYLAHQELEKTLLPVIEIAKKNNTSIADLTKALVIVGYKEGLTELLYRFAGRTLEGDLFYVQIKHDLRTGNKFLVSTFPAKKEPRKG